jgi:uncharacterized spore protein YtfJ
MNGRLSLDIRTSLAPEMQIGGTRLRTESRAIVLRLPWASFVWNRPLAVTAIRQGYGQRVQLHMQRPRGVLDMIETVNGSASVTATEQTQHQTDQFLDKILAATRPGAVFAPPVHSAGYTVITASEVFAGGGFGFGAGSGPDQHSAAAGPSIESGVAGANGGGGGGGGSHSRPVAAIVIGPDGVKVQPIVDSTRIVVAVMGALAGVVLVALRIGRAQPRHGTRRGPLTPYLRRPRMFSKARGLRLSR